MDIAAVGRQFGLNEAQTRAALSALAPVVAAGVRRTAQTPEGLQEMFRSVLTRGNSRVLEDEQEIGLGRAKPAGDDILGQIFGSKDVSREVAQRLSTTSGLDGSLLKKLLPIVAMIVMGQLSRKVEPSGAGGGLDEILGNVLGGGRQAQAQSGGGLGDILKNVFGERPVPRSSQPAPSPGSNPLEDILGDILGGGASQGRVVVKQVSPDQMGEILKDIFCGSPQHQPSEDTVARGRKTLDDMLGGGTKTGKAADDLLNSVENAVRHRL